MRLPAIPRRPSSRPDLLEHDRVLFHVSPAPALALVASGVTDGGVELPVVWEALERLDAAALEDQSAPDDEVLHGLRNKHLRGTGEGTHAGPDRDGDPGDVGSVELDLTGVESTSDLDPERRHRPDDRPGEPDPAGGAVERYEEPVPHRLDLATAESTELSPHDPVVVLADLAPPGVAQRGGVGRRVDDVGEQHGREDAIGRALFQADGPHETLDLRQDGVLVARPRVMVGANQLDECRAG